MCQRDSSSETGAVEAGTMRLQSVTLGVGLLSQASLRPYVPRATVCRVSFFVHSSTPLECELQEDTDHLVLLGFVPDTTRPTTVFN